MGSFVQFLANSLKIFYKTTDQKSFIFGLEYTVYRHGAGLSLCYPLMWNVILEYTATQFNVFGRPDHNDQRYDAIIVVANQNETSHIGLIHE